MYSRFSAATQAWIPALTGLAAQLLHPTHENIQCHVHFHQPAIIQTSQVELQMQQEACSQVGLVVVRTSITY